MTTPGFTVPLDDVPAPPPGPGVVPPFSSPPRDRDNKSVWIGLGVGGVALVLCCVGGIFGLRFMVAGSTELVRSQAHGVVSEYLDALRRARYADAYDLVCSRIAQRVSAQQFQARESAARVIDFSIDDVQVGQQIEVDTTVVRQGRGAQQERYPVKQENSVFTVCGGV